MDNLFAQIVPVLTETDQESARELIDKTLWVKKCCDSIDEELIAGKHGTISASDAVTIALYVRYLKRIAAHLLNALSSVVNPFEKIGFREDEDLV